MKKRFAIAMLVLLIFGTLPGVAQDRVDLIVLLDSSQSMIPYYNQVVDYVLSQTVREYMRFGDAFHLLSFSDSTQVEIAQVLKTEQDLKSVIARLYLLYPLGKNTDLVTALKNVYQYVADLPESSAKYIVLITDGMHSPAPRSPFAALDAAGVKAEIDRVASDIRAHGWTMRIVRVPFDTNGASTAAGTAGSGVAAGGQSSGKEAPSSSPGSGDYLSEVAAAVGTVVTTFDPQNSAATINDTIDLPVIDFPSDMGVKDYAFTIPVEIHNRSSRQISIELTKLLLEDGTDILTAKEFAEAAPGKSTRLILKVKLPGSIPAGATTLSLEPRFGDGLRVSPGISHVKVELKTSPLHVFFKSSFRIIMFIVLLVIASAAVLLVVLYVRTLHRKTEEPIVEAMIDSSHSVQAAHSVQASHVSPYAKQVAETVAVPAADEARERAAILAAASGTGQHQRAHAGAHAGLSRRQPSEPLARMLLPPPRLTHMRMSARRLSFFKLHSQVRAPARKRKPRLYSERGKSQARQEDPCRSQPAPNQCNRHRYVPLLHMSQESRNQVRQGLCCMSWIRTPILVAATYMPFMPVARNSLVEDPAIF